jgi:hypothetical protein
MRLQEFDIKKAFTKKETYYHGTADAYKDAILTNGLRSKPIFLTKDFNVALKNAMQKAKETNLSNDVRFTPKNNVVVFSVKVSPDEVEPAKVGQETRYVAKNDISPKSLSVVKELSYEQAQHVLTKKVA